MSTQLTDPAVLALIAAARAIVKDAEVFGLAGYSNFRAVRCEIKGLCLGHWYDLQEAVSNLSAAEALGGLKWTRKKGRNHYGNHAWITSRPRLLKGGVTCEAFLTKSQRWRASWRDKCDVLHWQWFAAYSDAKAWIETMATSSRAMTSTTNDDDLVTL